MITTNRTTKLLALIIILFISSSPLNATTNQLYTLTFLGARVNIEFLPKQDQNGTGIIAHLTGVAGVKDVQVDYYEPEGGATPEVKSVFVSGQPKRLFVIVAWEADVSALNTGGSIYQVFVYNECIENRGKPILQPASSLAERFGVGFDGVREGKPVNFKYKTAPSIKRQLLRWGY